jgi:hypothetical protein
VAAQLFTQAGVAACFVIGADQLVQAYQCRAFRGVGEQFCRQPAGQLRLVEDDA